MVKFDNIFQIHVSLYSDIPEVHDHITGVTGSFKKTLHAISLLTEASLDVRINCSVMTSNFASYQGLAENIANPYKIPIRFKPIILPRDDGSTENQVVKRAIRELL